MTQRKKRYTPQHHTRKYSDLLLRGSIFATRSSLPPLVMSYYVIRCTPRKCPSCVESDSHLDTMSPPSKLCVLAWCKELVHHLNHCHRPGHHLSFAASTGLRPRAVSGFHASPGPSQVAGTRLGFRSALGCARESQASSGGRLCRSRFKRLSE